VRVNLVNLLREFGCRVQEVDGHTTRGSDTFNPKGVVLHHTASAAGGDAPSLGICIKGRSDLPGPLCNVLISRSGVVYVVADGRANHAGSGGYNGLSGNSSVFGIEAENNGLGEPWSYEELDAYYRVCAAMLTYMKKDASWLIAHKQWAPKRKIDPANIDLQQFKDSVGLIMYAHAMEGHPGTPAAPVPPVTTPAPIKTPPTVKLGDGMPPQKPNDYVKVAQYVLRNKAGQRAVDVDGRFGPATEKAVKNVQAYFKLGADGVIGPKTWALLQALNK
jgi:hypothetical protein